MWEPRESAPRETKSSPEYACEGVCVYMVCTCRARRESSLGLCQMTRGPRSLSFIHLFFGLSCEMLSSRAAKREEDYEVVGRRVGMKGKGERLRGPNYTVLSLLAGASFCYSLGPLCFIRIAMVHAPCGTYRVCFVEMRRSPRERRDSMIN